MIAPGFQLRNDLTTGINIQYQYLLTMLKALLKIFCLLKDEKSFRHSYFCNKHAKLKKLILREIYGFLLFFINHFFRMHLMLSKRKTLCFRLDLDNTKTLKFS